MSTIPSHNLAVQIDEGFNLKGQIKALTARSDEIKINLRAAAAQENPDKISSGETIELKGIKHKAKINLAEDSFSPNDGATTTDILRLKAMVGQSVVSAEESVKLKEGVSLRKVKELLGETYSKIFEDDLKVKIKAEEMTKWLTERRRMGSSDDIVEFVERSLIRKSNTSRVTFSK